MEKWALFISSERVKIVMFSIELGRGEALKRVNCYCLLHSMKLLVVALWQKQRVESIIEKYLTGLVALPGLDPGQVKRWQF